MNKTSFWLFIFIICLLLGTFIRFNYGLTTDLWNDEALSYFTAKNTTYQDLFLSIGKYDDFVHPPFYYIFLKTCLLFGNNESWLRLISLFWFIPSLVLVFLIGRDIKNTQAGLITGSLFSLHPLFNNLAFQVRSYSMVIFFLLLALYFFLKQLKKYSLKGQLLTGLLLSISFYIDYASVWLIVSILIFNIILLIQKKRVLAKATFSTLLFFGFFSFYQIYVFVKSAISNDPNAIPGSVVLINIFRVTRELNLITGLGFSLLTLLILIATLLPIFKNKNNNVIFLTIATYVPLILSLVYSLLIKPVFLARNLFLPSICLFFLLIQTKINIKRIMLILLVLIAYGYQTINRYDFLYLSNVHRTIKERVSHESIFISFADKKLPSYVNYYLEQENKKPIIVSVFNTNILEFLDSQPYQNIFFIDNCYDDKIEECKKISQAIADNYCEKNVCSGLLDN